MRIFFFLSLLGTFISGGVVFHLKHEVLTLDNQIGMLSRNIAKNEEMWAVLKTEYAYVTHPERIAQLAHRHYAEAAALTKDQLIDFDFIDGKIHDAPKIISQNP